MTFYTLCRDLYGRTIGFYVDSVSIGDAFDVAAEQKGVALVIAAQLVNQKNLQRNKEALTEAAQLDAEQYFKT